MATKAKGRVQINNKKASFEYEFLEQYDAGIVLVGTEIKSLRAGKASLQDAYCYFSGGELYVRGMNIATYFWASAWSSHEPMRDRKLLLTRRTAPPCPGSEDQGPHHSRHARIHFRQRLREAPHSPGKGKEGVRQARQHQGKGHTQGARTRVICLKSRT